MTNSDFQLQVIVIVEELDVLNPRWWIFIASKVAWIYMSSVEFAFIRVQFCTGFSQKDKNDRFVGSFV